MATIIQFPATMPGVTCTRCDGKCYESVAFNQFVGENVAVPCGKCEGTGRFTDLMEAEGEVRYWRSRWESVQRHPRARKERQECSEQLEFWTNKAAMLQAMQTKGVR